MLYCLHKRHNKHIGLLQETPSSQPSEVGTYMTTEAIDTGVTSMISEVTDEDVGSTSVFPTEVTKIVTDTGLGSTSIFLTEATEEVTDEDIGYTSILPSKVTAKITEEEHGTTSIFTSEVCFNLN